MLNRTYLFNGVNDENKVVYSEKCLGYGTWHIEGPQRVKIAAEILKAKGYDFLEPTLQKRKTC